MRALIILFLLFQNDIYNVDFGDSPDAYSWVVVNDGVMGGLSSGQAFMEDNSIRFTGTVSLENNGGFASIRSRRVQIDLQGAEEIEIRYKLTGVDFAFQLNQFNRFWYPNYKYPLPKTGDEWVTVTIPIDSMRQSQVGNYTGRTFETANKRRPIIQVGFISDEKKENDYSLEVDYVIIR